MEWLMWVLIVANLAWNAVTSWRLRRARREYGATLGPRAVRAVEEAILRGRSRRIGAA